MKVAWKRAFLVAGFLTGLCAVLGAGIAGMDLLTRERIADNKAAKERNGLTKVFYEAKAYSDSIAVDDPDYPSLSKYYVVRIAEESEPLGRVYLSSGKNAYGDVSLLVGVYADFSLGNVYVLENTESYGPTLEEKYLDPYNEASDKEEAVTATRCGATEGAKLCRDLIKASQNHYKENQG